MEAAECETRAIEALECSDRIQLTATDIHRIHEKREADRRPPRVLFDSARTARGNVTHDCYSLIHCADFLQQEGGIGSHIRAVGRLTVEPGPSTQSAIRIKAQRGSADREVITTGIIRHG